MSEAQEKEITETGGKIAFVDYLILDDPPYLQAQECTSCGARYFDRRNACASCFKDQFRSVAIDQEGGCHKLQHCSNGTYSIRIRSG